MKALVELGCDDTGNYFKILFVGEENKCIQLPKEFQDQLEKDKIKYEKALDFRSKFQEVDQENVSILRLERTLLVEEIQNTDCGRSILKLIEQFKSNLEEKNKQKLNNLSAEEKELLNYLENLIVTPDTIVYKIIDPNTRCDSHPWN